MRIYTDTQRALVAVERLQERLKKRGELPAEEKLSLLKSVLQSPLFHQILIMQETGQQRKQQQVREYNIIIPEHDKKNALAQKDVKTLNNVLIK